MPEHAMKISWNKCQWLSLYFQNCIYTDALKTRFTFQKKLFQSQSKVVNGNNESIRSTLYKLHVQYTRAEVAIDIIGKNMFLQ